MTLSLAKLTIIVGAGLFGSVLAKEGRLPSMHDFSSGANKVLKIINTDEKSTSKPKPLNDSLMAQVNSLRQELQLLASNRPLTIVTTNGSGTTGKYGIIIIVVVLGYGYVWWKGWKLPDMMFATKRSLSDATNAVSKQLENVFSSLAATKRYLSSRIDRLDSSLDEVAELTAYTSEEVSGLRDKSQAMALDVKSVHKAFDNLKNKLDRIELIQDDTFLGVTRLLHTAASMENQPSVDCIQGNPSSSMPALELPRRAMSLPPVQFEELQSSPPVSPRVRRPLETAFSSASGLMALNEDPDVAEARSIPRASNGLNVTEDGSSSARIFGRTFSGISSYLSRACPPNKQ